jgi:hypothetical protein
MISACDIPDYRASGIRNYYGRRRRQIKRTDHWTA